MESLAVFFFLAFFVLMLGQAVFRRARNPYEEVPAEMLPATLRDELQRVLPGFQAREVRATRSRDEARLAGDYQGERFRVEADFDASGALVDFEVDGPRGFRKTGLSALDELPELARKEVERVLGGPVSGLERAVVKCGQLGGEEAFEVDGRCAAWKWEVAVTAAGRLLELEREARRRR